MDTAITRYLWPPRKTKSLIDLSEIVTLATRSIIHLGFSLQIQHLVIEILFELQGSQHVRWIRNFSTDSNCHLPIIYLTLPFLKAIMLLPTIKYIACAVPPIAQNIMRYLDPRYDLTTICHPNLR